VSADRLVIRRGPVNEVVGPSEVEAAFVWLGRIPLEEEYLKLVLVLPFSFVFSTDYPTFMLFSGVT
jgi:hypothetical protein